MGESHPSKAPQNPEYRVTLFISAVKKVAGHFFPLFSFLDRQRTYMARVESMYPPVVVWSKQPFNLVKEPFQIREIVSVYYYLFHPVFNRT